MAPAVRCIARKARENGGSEKNKARLARTRTERPFVWKSWKYASYYGVKLDPLALSAMWERQHGKCALTGRALVIQTAELDHIVPVSRGGALTLHNLRWVCPEANQAKGRMTDDEFLALCAEISECIGRAAMQYINARAAA
jgi:5-methylcytosine-specific restriction endonuclease McrA